MRSNNSNPGIEQGNAEQPTSNAQSIANPKRFAERVRSYFSEQKTWVWIERALLVSGLVLIVIYGAARIESILGSKAAIEQFNVVTSTGASDSTSPEPPGELQQPFSLSREIDFSSWSKKRVRAYEASANNFSSAPLAVLEIAAIDLEVPVFEGTDDLTLNHGAGWIAGTAQPGESGNMGIAAHRDGFFRGLKNVKAGDEIQLRTHGGTQLYVVDEIEIVKPSDVTVLRTRSRPSLTLVTCYPFYFIGSAPQRYVVSASLMEAPEVQAVEVGTRFTHFTQKGERP
jgi:sortase A